MGLITAVAIIAHYLIIAHRVLVIILDFYGRDSRRIYRALIYIAVPYHGPHRLRYIGSTLYRMIFR